MWISKKKHEEEILELEEKNWEESRRQRYEDRQNERIQRLEERLGELEGSKYVAELNIAGRQGKHACKCGNSHG